MSGLAALSVFPPSTFSAAYHWSGINIHLIKSKHFSINVGPKQTFTGKIKKKLNTNRLHNVANLLLLAVKLLMRLSGIGPLSLKSSINLPKHFSFIYGYVLTILDYISHLIIHNFSKFVKFVLIIKNKIQSNNVHGKFFLCMIYICLCLSLYPSNRLLGESKQRSNGKHFYQIQSLLFQMLF